MRFLLDTDTCSAHMRRPTSLAHRFIQFTGQLAISTINLAELYAGAYKAIYEKGGLNLASLTDEQQIEAEDDYRICVRRGTIEEAKPKKRRSKMMEDDE